MTLLLRKHGEHASEDPTVRTPRRHQPRRTTAAKRDTDACSHVRDAPSPSCDVLLRPRLGTRLHRTFVYAWSTQIWARAPLRRPPNDAPGADFIMSSSDRVVSNAPPTNGDQFCERALAAHAPRGRPNAPSWRAAPAPCSRSRLVRARAPAHAGDRPASLPARGSILQRTRDGFDAASRCHPDSARARPARAPARTRRAHVRPRSQSPVLVARRAHSRPSAAPNGQALAPPRRCAAGAAPRGGPHRQATLLPPPTTGARPGVLLVLLAHLRPARGFALRGACAGWAASRAPRGSRPLGGSRAREPVPRRLSSDLSGRRLAVVRGGWRYPPGVAR